MEQKKMSKLSALNVSTLYDVTIPSSGEKVKFRAYNVKEERALLTADESKDGSVMISTLNYVVLNCLMPAPEHLTSFDLEYLFAQIRAKSVGEISTISVGCDEKECVEKEISIEYKYNLSDLQVVFPPNKDMNIVLSDSLAIKMKYPSVEDSLRVEQLTSDSAKRYEAIKSSIDIIYSGDEAIKVSEEPENEIISFVDNLNPKQYKKLEEFFEEMPFVEGTLKYRCTNCKKEHIKKIQGLLNFF